MSHDDVETRRLNVLALRRWCLGLIAVLPPRELEAVVLCHACGLSRLEAGRRMEISGERVAQLQHRAYERLKAHSFTQDNPLAA